MVAMIAWVAAWWPGIEATKDIRQSWDKGRTRGRVILVILVIVLVTSRVPARLVVAHVVARLARVSRITRIVARWLGIVIKSQIVHQKHPKTPFNLILIFVMKVFSGLVGRV